MVKLHTNKKLYSYLFLSQDNNCPKNLIEKLLWLKDNSFWRS